MNPRREAWAKVHGPIPKGWVVHNLNGNPSDIRPENLGAVPRKTDNISQVAAPYRARIKALELKLKKENENGSS